MADYYHDTLKQSPEALAYLHSRGLNDPEMVAHFKLGFAHRTLGYRLPEKNRKAGAESRGRLQRLGVIRESGHEHFNGSVIFPIFDLAGGVLGLYGRKITAGLREGTPLQPSKEIIVCQSIIDALTFWCAGFRHVTASYGVGGFTDDHRRAVREHGVQRVWIAYDRDDAGESAALALADELMAMGIECFRVLFPKGMNANEYALKITPAEKSLEVLINKAHWLGKGKAPERARVEVIPVPDEADAAAKEEEIAPVPSLAAQAAPATIDVPAEVKAEEILITLGDRRYRVRGLAKSLSYEILRVNLLASNGDGFHVDTLDLYSARQRAVYVKPAAVEMAVKEDAVKRDLGRALLKLERKQDATEAMNEPDCAAALELLHDPKLLDRILDDLERCGVVGEETYKLAGYISTVSRHLEAP